MANQRAVALSFMLVKKGGEWRVESGEWKVASGEWLIMPESVAPPPFQNSG